jgi:EpsI family protein
MMKVLIAAAFLALNFYTYYELASQEVAPPRKSFASFPLELGDWSCAGPQEMEPKVLQNLGVTDYLICTFTRRAPTGLVGVYVGYHESQVRKEGGGSGENSIHPPRHCLPGSGWNIMDAEVVDLELPGLFDGGANVNRLIIAKGNERQLVYYWYQSRGRVIADDWRKIVALFFDRATRQRTDGSLVRFTIPILRGQVEPAEAAFRDLASGILPQLDAYVPN